MFWGPLWDFDLTLLNTGEGEEEDTRFGFNNTETPWIDHLRDSDPLFDEILVQQWNKLDLLLTELTAEGGVLDQMETDRKFTRNKKSATVKGYGRTSKRVTNLKAKKKYFIRIRTYKKIGKKTYWSGWSKIQTVTIR